jgi:uncharacterized protein YbjT (DUF2867 family)
LLTGATGYVGGRLLQRLKNENCLVRCLVRQPGHLYQAEGTEVVQGDVMALSSLKTAMDGMDMAFYLVHSMGSRSDFEKMDRLGAGNFAKAAAGSSLKRIIYLSGLGDQSQELSSHLKSRQEVGDILRKSTIPVIELRASVVIGSGSLSFELVRSLTERLPVMIMPRWVMIEAQPIGISDLLEYLVQSIYINTLESRIYEIGGSDTTSYYGLMREYARQRGLKRWMFRVPVLTPWLSSLWLGLVTPIYARIGRKLIEGIKNPTVVTDFSARLVFDVKPQGFSEAIRLALINEKATDATGDVPQA